MPSARLAPFLSPFEGERWLGEAETEWGLAAPYTIALLNMLHQAFCGVLPLSWRIKEG
jgi:hypothetical protein